MHRVLLGAVCCDLAVVGLLAAAASAEGFASACAGDVGHWPLLPSPDVGYLVLRCSRVLHTLIAGLRSFFLSGRMLEGILGTDFGLCWEKERVPGLREKERVPGLRLFQGGVFLFGMVQPAVPGGVGGSSGKGNALCARFHAGHA